MTASGSLGRLFFRIFPESVCGSSVTNTTSRGTMKFSSRVLHSRITSSSVSCSAFVEEHEGANRLAEQLVGNPEHGRLADARHVVERVLDLDGADLLAARLDDVVAAVDEVEVAVLVDREVVVGAHRARSRIGASCSFSAVSSGERQ